MKSPGERISEARSAGTSELWKIIRDPSSDVVAEAALNRNFTEEMAVFTARGKTASSETLAYLAGDIRFKTSYKLKLALCKNPKTPQRVAFSLLKFLRIFDLSDITRNRHLPVNFRQKIENDILQRIPSMPSGIMKALAKRVNSTLLMALIEKGDESVASVCLESPYLTEGDLYRLINRPGMSPYVIRLIAGHPKWSIRYSVRFTLIRNFYTPMQHVTRFIGAMKTYDLRDLYADPKLPSSTRPFIHRELLERNESAELPKEEIYELDEDDDTG